VPGAHDGRPALEVSLADLLAHGKHREAATAALRGYGPEILGYLVAILHERDDAYDVFSEFSEELWKSLGGFQGGSSFRTWAYGIAWNVAKRFERSRARRHSRPLRTSEASQLAGEIRATTAVHQRTETKQRLARIRESLDRESQTLLVLRIDRGLSWSEVAQVLSSEGAILDEVAVRKRFSRLKDRLREELAKKDE
jgi:RNA polymerase sigma-70 factor, ECF subfamily